MKRIMKKLTLSVIAVSFLAGIAVAVLTITACSQDRGTVQQSDFHGTWVNEVTEGGGTTRIELTFTENLITRFSTTTFPFIPDTRMVFEIFSREAVRNNDPQTMADFPSGFLFGIRTTLLQDAIQLYMHRDGDRFLYIGTYRGETVRLVYENQQALTQRQAEAAVVDGVLHAGGNITITGIPAMYNGKWAYFFYSSNSADINLLVGANVIMPPLESINIPTRKILPQISGGSVTLPVWRLTPGDWYTRFSGNTTIDVWFSISSTSQTYFLSQNNVISSRFWENIILRGGNATLTWASGEGF